MTEKSDHLAQTREAFCKRWEPHGEFCYARRSEFTVELDRLIYLAFEVAQEPYTRELQLYRDNAAVALFPKPPIKP